MTLKSFIYRKGYGFTNYSFWRRLWDYLVSAPMRLWRLVCDSGSCSALVRRAAMDRLSKTYKHSLEPRLIILMYFVSLTEEY